jgi:hypothetical protein
MRCAPCSCSTTPGRGPGSSATTSPPAASRSSSCGCRRTSATPRGPARSRTRSPTTWWCPLGAIWSLYDRAQVGTWIDRELDLLRRADEHGVPVLGHLLRRPGAGRGPRRRGRAGRPARDRLDPGRDRRPGPGAARSVDAVAHRPLHLPPGPSRWPATRCARRPSGCGATSRCSSTRRSTSRTSANGSSSVATPRSRRSRRPAAPSRPSSPTAAANEDRARRGRRPPRGRLPRRGRRARLNGADRAGGPPVTVR